MPTVLIVGAGVSGLSVAYRLQQRLPQAEVVVVDARDRPGGTAWTVREDGFTVEIGPNGFLDTKPTTVELCRDLELGERLVAASEAAGKNRYLLLDGKLQALPGSPAAVLSTNLLTWRGKLGLLLERWRSKPRNQRDESIDAFVRRRAGAEVADLLADALVTGIYAGDPKLLSLPACFPRLAAFEREHGSVIKGFAAAAKQRRAEARAKGNAYQRPGKMWSLQDGLRVLVEALAEQLHRRPILGMSIRALIKDSTGWLVRGEGSERWRADAVVLTCPAYQQAALLAEVDVELAQRIATIAYNRVAVVALGFRRGDVPSSLDGFGFIAPQNTRRDLLGVQWCSSIFPGRAPEGAVLLRAMCGGWHRPEMVGWDDDRLLTAVRAELRLAQGITAPPIFHKVIRWDRAIPQYHVGHLERVAWIENRVVQHAGLFLGGNAYRGVALNDCTEQGAVLAQRVQKYLPVSPQALGECGRR